MTLLERIQSKDCKIGIIGQGYVGLPLALVFVEAGFPVIGLDLDNVKVAALNRGESYIKHIGSERVSDALKTGRFRASTNFDDLSVCDAVLICVPTPLGPHREPDLSFVLDSSREVAKRLRKGQLVVLESTTYPGTTDEDVLPALEATGLKTPDDFLLAFSPEREDPGNPKFHTKIIPKVVGGVNAPSTEAAVALYQSAIDKVVAVSSARVAESSKLLENIFRSIDIWEVIEAARTKPFGFTPFYPGPGLGGHCIPLDPFYLSWKAAEYGIWTRFIELAGEINTHMPHYVVDKTVKALNEAGRSIRGAKVLVLGLSYKENIDDDRESPSYEIIELLREAGAVVAYCDPFFPTARPGRKHNLKLASVPCTAESFGQHDAVVLSAGHAQFRDPGLYAKVGVLVDSRNAVKLPAGSATRLVRA
jgi:UDP-N-acetyl-D-glucosamine dehydrogenase